MQEFSQAVVQTEAKMEGKKKKKETNTTTVKTLNLF